MESKTLTKPNIINEIVIPDTPATRCNHVFEFVADGCKCKKCHMGLKGVLELKNGRPYL
jgi:hypothetical protein